MPQKYILHIRNLQRWKDKKNLPATILSIQTSISLKIIRKMKYIFFYVYDSFYNPRFMTFLSLFFFFELWFSIVSNGSVIKIKKN